MMRLEKKKYLILDTLYQYSEPNGVYVLINTSAKAEVNMMSLIILPLLFRYVGIGFFMFQLLHCTKLIHYYDYTK